VHTLQNTGLDVNVVECAALDRLPAACDGPAVDLMILDLQMPGYQGLDSRAGGAQPPARMPVLVLSGNEDPAMVRECIDLGACGFVPKSRPSDEFHAALTLVLSGGVYLPPTSLSVGRRPAARSRTPGPPGRAASRTASARCCWASCRASRTR
jgi:DNA-binding NarL/FixJ family response regulator